VWLLPRGMPSSQRLVQVHRTGRYQSSAPLQPSTRVARCTPPRGLRHSWAKAASATAARLRTVSRSARKRSLWSTRSLRSGAPRRNTCCLDGCSSDERLSTHEQRRGPTPPLRWPPAASADAFLAPSSFTHERNLLGSSRAQARHALAERCARRAFVPALGAVAPEPAAPLAVSGTVTTPEATEVAPAPTTASFFPKRRPRRRRPCPTKRVWSSRLDLVASLFSVSLGRSPLRLPG